MALIVNAAMLARTEVVNASVVMIATVAVVAHVILSKRHKFRVAVDLLQNSANKLVAAWSTLKSHAQKRAPILNVAADPIANVAVLAKPEVAIVNVVTIAPAAAVALANKVKPATLSSLLP